MKTKKTLHLLTILFILGISFMYVQGMYAAKTGYSATGDIGDPPVWNWSHEFGGAGGAFANDLVTDDAGNIYVTGSFSGEITYMDSSYVSSGLRDAFIAKFSANNELMWLAQIESGLNENSDFNNLHLDSEGNVYATGYYTGDIEIGGTSLSGENRRNLLYVKWDNDGNLQLAGKHDTDDEEEQGNHITTDQDGNIYVLSVNDILKYDMSGNLLWEKAESEEIFQDFKIIGDHIYYTGYILSPEGAIDTVGYLGGPFDYNDMFIARSNLDGNFDMVKLPQHGENPGNGSRAYSMALDQNNNIYLGGYFYGNFTVDTVDLTIPEGGFNMFVLKLDSNGQAIQGSTVPGTRAFSILTASPEGETYLYYRNGFYKFGSDGSLEVQNEDIAYSINALHVDPSTGSLLASGSTEGELFYAAYDNTLNATSMQTFSGKSASVGFQGMVSDDMGNVYVYGYTDADFEYFNDTVPAGVFLAKHDEDGTLQWLKKINPARANGDLGDQIVISPDNEYVYIAGSFTEELAVAGGTTLTPGEGNNVFILKYAKDGSLSHAKKIENLQGNSLDLTVDYSGGLIYGDTFNDTIQIGSDTHIPQGGDDVLLIKYNAAGDIQWSKQAGGVAAEYMGLTDVDSSDNIYLTGEFASQEVVFGDSSKTMNDGDGNIFLSKINAEGTIQWIKTQAGTVSETQPWLDGSCWPTDIKTLPDGHSYIKGWHGDSIAFSDTVLNSEFGNYNYFIGKFDPQGEAVWVHSIEEKQYGFDYNQMDVDDEGNVYLGAQIRDTIIFKAFDEAYEYAPAGQNDLFIASYSSMGEINWVKTMGSKSGYNWLSAVAVTDTNRIYAGGHYNFYISIGDDEYYTPSRHGFFARVGEDIAQSIDDAVIFGNNSDNTESIQVYPNPVSNELNIRIPDGQVKGQMVVRVLSLKGQVMYSKTTAAGERTNLNLGHLEQGVYIISVNMGNQTYHQRIIKE